MNRIVIRVKSIFSQEKFTFDGNYDALILLLLIGFNHFEISCG